MRDIRGLEERLATLQNLILQTEKICEEQAANANSEYNTTLLLSSSILLSYPLLAYKKVIQLYLGRCTCFIPTLTGSESSGDLSLPS